MNPTMEDHIKALIKALETGGYNAVPTSLVNGDPLAVESPDSLEKAWDESIASAENSWRTPIIGVKCDHKWKTYIGFTEKYDYCEKCDVKKE